MPPGRGNCPLTMPLPFNLICTDYHGLFFIGFGFPHKGLDPLEAIAHICIFLQSHFIPPHRMFFPGKPTSKEVFSQHPYAENFIGKPHVWTVDYNLEESKAAIRAIMETQGRFCAPGLQQMGLNCISMEFR
ncbi:Alpha-1,6-mannosylglycoprotein 6-beta-N-acetylglucosaminyltransferase B [Sciurus carolinensis]|uniref:alpha-1,6-mannosyl-glycoprotein 6-beta-N-acetylglucosaminyltransferase n=1 Tax=Sciurus carolinensis TaxID=30640 RepID=A0AA41MLK1_SCICA|nr:Alpha-1,6-mannosylglycoprotein 6-beta-N-acetylglucosaminyltransferase B [Sciurus carolinensis]